MSDKKMTDAEQLQYRIAGEINGLCRENDSNTPDFLLAEFMVNCLDAFELASNKREVWYGVHLDIGNKWSELIMTAIGEASTCWSNLDGAGTFDTTRAKEIGEQLLADIKKER